MEDLNHADREEKIYFSNKMIHVSILWYGTSFIYDELYTTKHVFPFVI